MKSDFQRWWNEKYFYTSDPLYQSYEKLCRLGADFHYVDFLRGWLEMGDFFQRMGVEQMKRAVTPKHPFVAVLSKHREDIQMLFVKMYGFMVVYYTVEELKSHLAAAAGNVEQCKVISQWLDEVSPRVRNEAQKITREAWLGLTYAFIQQQTNRNQQKKEELKETQPIYKPDLARMPILEVLREYYPPVLPKRGNKGDPWGSFFLLAVTEHMRENTKHPHFQVAIGLLRKVRSQSGKSAHRETATARVQQLKKSHPNWKYHLTLVKKQFALQLAQVAPINPAVSKR